ncbi:SDR family NAD(P)-dependent oxidoreductase [Streptomyces sp. NPDC026672]|uniref:SDR family NAD(P)-dependent oxidoreductase n=1 Tax=unclassified Streptomyces TaxID=2593676 RepID=UPI0033F535C5
MARVLVTGSADGLGLMSARLLVAQGHTVVLHARDARRAEDALAAAPGAKSAISGDLSSLAGMRETARQANALGRFDAVVHNAGVGYLKPRRVTTEDGLEQHFAVNVLAPYVLTALVTRPDRLVYVSSGLHRGGTADLGDLGWERRPWNGMRAYSDSKLQVTALARYVSGLWGDVLSNGMEPGWVATRMGGPEAPDDLELAPVTQVWLAVSDDPAARTSGGYFYHQEPCPVHPAVLDPEFGRRVAEVCREASGIDLPAA